MNSSFFVSCYTFIDKFKQKVKNLFAKYMHFKLTTIKVWDY